MLVALWARLRGIRIYVELDSKFDDKPRRLLRELGKRIMLTPYVGGLASGKRAADYLRFLGLRDRPIALGYDSVSLARIRALAQEPPPPWDRRAFLVVARFVPKKNLAMLLRGYAAYATRVGDAARRLRLCGAGPGENELRAATAALGIHDRVDFLGFVDQRTIAQELASALCLLLPSTEEQWGLVVNEALAFGLPLVVSNVVGACDALVDNLSNGLILDPHDAETWGSAMELLGSNRPLWDRMHQASLDRAPCGDVAAFVAGVEMLVGHRPDPVPVAGPVVDETPAAGSSATVRR